MTALTTSSDPTATYVRQCLQAILSHPSNTSNGVVTPSNVSSLLGSGVGGSDTHPPVTSPSNLFVGNDATTTPGTAPQQELRRIEELEDLLFRMITWLRSRLILQHLLEFVVSVHGSYQPILSQAMESIHNSNQTDSQTLMTGSAITSVGGGNTHSQNERSEKKIDGPSPTTNDESLLQDLLACDCLRGRKSLQYASWLVGLDPPRLRSLVSRHDSSLRIVSRAPTVRDEW